MVLNWMQNMTSNTTWFIQLILRGKICLISILCFFKDHAKSLSRPSALWHTSAVLWICQNVRLMLVHLLGPSLTSLDSRKCVVLHWPTKNSTNVTKETFSLAWFSPQWNVHAAYRTPKTDQTLWQIDTSKAKDCDRAACLRFSLVFAGCDLRPTLYCKIRSFDLSSTFSRLSSMNIKT